MSFQDLVDDFSWPKVPVFKWPLTPKEQRIEIIKKTMKKMPLLSDQISLIEDLKIYLQNKTLSDLTGNKIPEREPKDPSLPKIVSHNGKLTITG